MITATDWAELTAPSTPSRLQAAATKEKSTRAAHPARVEQRTRARIAQADAAREKVASIAAREGVSPPLIIRVAIEYGLPLRGRGNKPAHYSS